MRTPFSFSFSSSVTLPRVLLAAVAVVGISCKPDVELKQKPQKPATSSTKPALTPGPSTSPDAKGAFAPSNPATGSFSSTTPNAGTATAAASWDAYQKATTTDKKSEIIAQIFDMPPAEAVDFSNKALDSEKDPEVRAEIAAVACTALEEEERWQLMTRLLDTKEVSPDARFIAFQTLGDYPPERIKPVYQNLTKDADEMIRDEATQILKILADEGNAPLPGAPSLTPGLPPSTTPPAFPTPAAPTTPGPAPAPQN